MIRILIIFIGSIIWSGCSVSTQFYLRNLTDQQLLLKARSFERDTLRRVLLFEEGMIDIDYNLYKSFESELKQNNREGSYVFYSVPPNSTVFLGVGSNFRNLEYDQITLYKNGHEIVHLSWTNSELFKKDKRFLNRYFLWYDVLPERP